MHDSDTRRMLLELLALGDYLDDGSVRPVLLRLAARIADVHELSKGSTLDWDGYPVPSGYAVSSREGAQVLTGECTVEAIVSFLERNWRRMLELNCVLGTWLNAEKHYLGFTRVLTDVETANAHAVKEQQLYFQDLARGEEIATRYDVVEVGRVSGNGVGPAL